MKNHIYQLNVNGKYLTKAQGIAGINKEEFIKYAKEFSSEFDPAKDQLEIVDVTPIDNSPAKSLLHPKSRGSVDEILMRHVENLNTTYGQDKVTEFLKKMVG